MADNELQAPNLLSLAEVQGLQTEDDVRKNIASIDIPDYEYAFFKDEYFTEENGQKKRKDDAPKPPMDLMDVCSLKLKYVKSQNDQLREQNKNIKKEKEKLEKENSSIEGYNKSWLEPWKIEDFMGKIDYTNTELRTTGKNNPSQPRHKETEFAIAAELVYMGIAGPLTALGKAAEIGAGILRRHGYEEAAKRVEEAGALVKESGKCIGAVAHNVFMTADWLLQPPTDNVADLLANFIKASFFASKSPQAAQAGQTEQEEAGKKKNSPNPEPAPEPNLSGPSARGNPTPPPTDLPPPPEAPQSGPQVSVYGRPNANTPNTSGKTRVAHGPKVDVMVPDNESKHAMQKVAKVIRDPKAITASFSLGYTLSPSVISKGNSAARTVKANK